MGFLQKKQCKLTTLILAMSLVDVRHYIKTNGVGLQCINSQKLRIFLKTEIDYKD